MDEKLLQLPWQIQAALGVGYLSYAISYTGIKQHHKQTDVLFVSIFYSAIALLAITLYQIKYETISSALLGGGSTIALAIAWRVIGIDLYNGILRVLDISWSDNSPSAWSSISNSKICVTQIAVQHEDGTWLRCDDAMRFSNLPFGPCQFGPDGDIALYLTHEESLGKEPKVLQSTVDDNYGARITYVPSSKIKRVTVRYRKQPSRLWMAVAAGVRWLCRMVPSAKKSPTECEAGN